MCGIAAFYSYADANPINIDLLARVRDFMHSRGPDDKGIYQSDNKTLGMAHRRLSIIDLSDKAHQPMMDANGNAVLVFNGEIYNYKSLRTALIKKGYVFNTNSDTEVILNLYLDRGLEFVNALQGMFALALYDKRAEMLVLARDPFGIKPLYYYDNGKQISIASQVRALRQIPEIKTMPFEPAGQVGFYMTGSIPEPYTLYRNIFALPAGSIMCVSRHKKPVTRRYFDSTQTFLNVQNPIAKQMPVVPVKKIYHSIVESVEKHLVADVPVGVFLSSGLDSSLILAIIRQELGYKVQTVTLGFEAYRGTVRDETLLAERVANTFETEHKTIWLDSDDFFEHETAFFEAMDQPTIDGLNTYFVSMAAKKVGLKVALSGVGGDELFAGYNTFSHVPRMVRNFGWVPKPMGRLFRQLGVNCMGKLVSPKQASVFEYSQTLLDAYWLKRCLTLPWQLKQVLPASVVHEGWQKLAPILFPVSKAQFRNARQFVSACEIDFYMKNQLLRDTDWASMAHSLEVRIPFVDKCLFSEVMPLMGNLKLFKQQLFSLFSSSLPKALLEREKTGFYVPVREWLMAKSDQKALSMQHWATHVYKNFGGVGETVGY